METVRDNPVLNKVFGLFQDYQKTGQFSRLLLETRGGAFTAHLSVQCSAPWIERTRPTETRKSLRRTTPSRRRRNQARRDQWLAKKNHQNISDPVVNQDENLEKTENSEAVEDLTVLTETNSKDLKILADDQSTQLIHSIEEVSGLKKTFIAIEQIDGMVESKEPPEFINCIKLDMEGFVNAETAESKIRDILDDSDIEINKLNILHSQSNYQTFRIEIEDFKYTTLVDLKQSLKRTNKGINLEIQKN